MSKRLQVLLGDEEYRRVQDAARRHGQTMSSWVRHLLREAQRQEPSVAADRKLAAIRAALPHAFPAPDVDRMLEEIERGYLEP